MIDLMFIFDNICCKFIAIDFIHSVVIIINKISLSRTYLLPLCCPSRFQCANARRSFVIPAGIKSSYLFM